MTAMARTWDRLTLPGKALAIIIPLGACFVISRTGTLQPIDIWLAILAGHVTRCALSVLRFRQGRWRSIAVSIGPS